MNTTVDVFVNGVGMYVPPARRNNRDLAQQFSVNEDWIIRRTGIHSRRIAGAEQTTSDLAFEAAKNALSDASISATDLDLIVLATLSPDQPMPATACFLQAKLGAPGVPAFDVSAACSGFLYAISVAQQFIAAGSARTVLVVGAEACSRLLDPNDLSTSILFGDGAGAAVLSNRPGRLRLNDVRLGADGSATDLIRIEGGGSRVPTSQDSLNARQHFVRLEGREVFRAGVAKFAELVEAARFDLESTSTQIAQVILHQSNARMITAAAEQCGVPASHFWSNVERYGNTCSASIPISLCEYLKSGAPDQGHIVMAAVGAGLTWGSAVCELVPVEKPIRKPCPYAGRCGRVDGCLFRRVDKGASTCPARTRKSSVDPIRKPVPTCT